MRKEFVCLLLIVTLAFLLRFLWLPSNLFFGFEQGRDLLKLKEVLSGNLTLIGPKTDIDGFFHGALSYYLPLPFFILSQGNPLGIQTGYIIINCLAIVLLYFFLKNFLNQRIAWLSVIFYSISYSSIIYHRWQSNPTLVPALTIGLLYFLNLAKKNNYFLVISALLWSIIFHLEIVAAIVLVPPILIFIFSQKIKLNFKIIFLVTISIFSILSSYLIFNFRNQNLLSNSFLKYLANPKDGVFDYQGPINQFLSEVTDSFGPNLPQVALAILFISTLFSVIYGFKNKRLWIILSFLFTPLLAYLIYAMRPQRHFYIIIPIFLSIILAVLINYLLDKKLTIFALITIFIVAGLNLRTYLLNIPTSKANFIHHAQRTYLKDQLKIIDYLYQQAHGNNFSYDYYSVPYWKNDAWRYLFSWYGFKKYGYLPQDQKTQTFYLIIEPDESNPKYQQEWYQSWDQNSVLKSKFKSGHLQAEQRQKMI